MVKAQYRLLREKLGVEHLRLVLGTSKTLPDGHANLFYRSRIEAAARLFTVGRVRWLIVSGNQEAPNANTTTSPRRLSDVTV